MQNFSLRTKLQNIICSEQFCGLCFVDTKEISTDVVLEVASDEWSHRMKLGDIYRSVFKESNEGLASKIICSNCADHLIRSYTFIKNTKYSSQSLIKYLNNLQAEILKLNNYKNIDKSENICIILADEINKESKVSISNDRKELHCTLCQKNFGALKDFLNHYRAHSRNKLMTPKKDMEIEKFKMKHLKSNRMTLELTELRSLDTQKPNHEVPEKNMIHNIDTEIISTKSHGTTEIYKTVPVIEKSDKVLIRKEIKCIMCLKDIGDQSHLCEFKCSKCNDPSCKHLEHLIHFHDQILIKSEAICLHCDFICRDKEVLIEHVNRHHLNQYKCELCGQNFPTKMAIQTHLASSQLNCIVHNVKAFGKKQEHKNNNINLRLAERIESVKDMKLKKISCDKCQRCFDNVTTLQHHQKSHRRVKINANKLREHLKIHSEKDLKCIKRVNKNITCELCGYITWNSILLECHMNQYHLKIKPYICHICSKNFIGKHLLKKHIKTHTVDQSIICNFCGKKLLNLSCLKNHLKLHTGEKNYECTICGEKFRTASIRSVHRVKKHSVREASCPLCLSKFYTLTELRRHIIKTHWKKKTKFDPRELEGLENHYHLFHDGRRIRMGDEVDFYMPC